MLIALLAVLGVDLSSSSCSSPSCSSQSCSRASVGSSGQPGAFRGAIRVSGGEIDGLSPNSNKRLDEPIVVRVRAGAATVDVAAQSDDGELLLGPYRPPADTTAPGGS